MPYGSANLHEVFDRTVQLIVEDRTVRDHNDGLEYCFLIPLESDELVCEPGNGVGFSAAGGMLHQVLSSDTSLAYVREEFPDDVKLMIAWEDLLALFASRFLILDLDDLRIVLNDVSEILAVE